MPDDFARRIERVLTSSVVPFAGRFFGALLLWVLGGWVIQTASALTQRAMAARHIEPTLMRYADSALRVALRIALVTFILSVFGVETTSFAAFVAAAGVAIGAAWAGLLSNFAAGAFLIILRPFKVGDMIAAGGVTGVVREIGLFATTLDQADDVRAVIGNNKIFADNIVNYSANPTRRVELVAQVAHDVDIDDAIARLRARGRGSPRRCGARRRGRAAGVQRGRGEARGASAHAQRPLLAGVFRHEQGDPRGGRRGPLARARAAAGDAHAHGVALRARGRRRSSCASSGAGSRPRRACRHGVRSRRHEKAAHDPGADR